MTKLFQVDLKTATRDELVVECHRLSGVVQQFYKQKTELKGQVEELTNMLGQAQAGMEMADLIKRMVG